MGRQLKAKWKTFRKRIVPRTLFGRSLMIILLPLLLLQMIVAFIFFDRHWDTMTDKLTSALAGDIDMIVREAQAAPDGQGLPVAQKTAQLLGLDASLEGRKIGDMPVRPAQVLAWFAIDDRLREALKARLDEPFSISGHRGRARLFEVRVGLNAEKTLLILCPESRLSSPTTYIFILWMLGGSVVLSSIAVLFMRNQIRPIRRLAVAAEKFGKGQDVPSFRPEGAAEVRQAARAFIEMQGRLKRQIEQRTAMLSGVSHDLRTPLTRMKLQLAMARATPEVENLRQDVEEMEKMVEGYLAFAKGEGSETVEMTDLHTVVDRVVANARRQGYDVQAGPMPERMMIRVRPVAVERAIANIVSNACKYAPHVWVGAAEQGGLLILSVEDDGPGIPLAQREDVFRPFYRLEKSRNKKTGGLGLGLSIARDVAHAHGGEVWIEDSPRGGARVVVRLPV